MGDAKNGGRVNELIKQTKNNNKQTLFIQYTSTHTHTLQHFKCSSRSD